MNFREYENVKIKVFTALTGKLLTAEINKFCNKVDLLDVQYSTHGVSTYTGQVSESFSALVIYKEKGE